MGGSSSSNSAAGPDSSQASGTSAPSGTNRPQVSSREIVKLNVYTQLQVYHSGVEVLGAEYVFGGGDTSHSGVTAQRPRIAPPGTGWVFYQTVDIGPLQLSREEVHRAIAELQSEFPGNSYDLISRNCNSFADVFCRRLTGNGIPGWVNRLAGTVTQLGLDSVARSVAGLPAASSSSSSSKAEGGVGGPAAAGLVVASAGTDGDLVGQVDWGHVGVLGADCENPGEALRGRSAIISEAEADVPELLLLMPFTSPVKLQAVRLDAVSAELAPSRVRLFANDPNLDMDDALGGVATQEFADDKITWTKLDGSSDCVRASLEVTFLKFQKLFCLGIYLSRIEQEGEVPTGPQVSVPILAGQITQCRCNNYYGLGSHRASRKSLNVIGSPLRADSPVLRFQSHIAAT